MVLKENYLVCMLMVLAAEIHSHILRTERGLRFFGSTRLKLDERNVDVLLIQVVLAMVLLACPIQRVVAADVPFSAGKVIDGNFDGASYVYATDIDGDGDLDVLGTAYDVDTYAWWENTNGDGTAWSKHVIDTGCKKPSSVYAADIDGDGDIDVLGHTKEPGSYPYDGDVIWWENTNGFGTAWSKHIVDADFDCVISIYAADIDGDDDLDVLGGNFSFDDNIAWWENTNGAGTAWSKHVVDSSFDGAYSVNVADMDGDNDPDIIAAAFQDNAIAWWENANGLGTSWTKHAVDGDVLGASSVHAGDMDGDGDADILGTAFHGDYIAWWENANRMGTAWTRHVLDASYYGASEVCAADIDDDNDLDILGTARYDDDISWWENTNGDGSSWTKHTIDGAFDGALCVYAADVDDDGDPDVLGAARSGNDVTWWENLLTKPRCADFSGDSFVNFSDYCVLAQEWLEEGDSLEADLVVDSKVDELDLAAFCSQWLSPCP